MFSDSWEMQYDENGHSYGNWWLVASSWLCARSCIMCHIQFWGEILNYPGDLAPHSPYLAPWDFWPFQKLKSPLKGKRFWTFNKIQENTMGQLMAIGRTVWGPKVPTLKGTEASLSYVHCFMYLISSSINVSIFYITWLDISWMDLVQSVLLTVITELYLKVYAHPLTKVSLFPLLLSPQQPPFYSQFPWVLRFHLHEITQYLSFSDCFLIMGFEANHWGKTEDTSNLEMGQWQSLESS